MNRESGKINKITITGLAGVGKGTTAKLTAKELGWEAYSAGDFQRELAKEHGYTLPEYEEITKSQPEFDKKTEARAEALGKEKENFVYEGRLGWYFIPDSLKVKTVCEDEERFRRIQQRENKPIEQVKRETLHREEAIRIRFEKYFGIDDWANDNHFDFLVDTTKNPPEEVVRLILEEKKRRESQT
jgi:cytidylate kinase